MGNGLKAVEKLRTIWTPKSEVAELLADLNPGTELDSQIREYFCRIIDAYGSISLDITNPVPEFDIRMEVVHTGETPGAKRQVTIWKVPKDG